jgi:spermidine synthase
VFSPALLYATVFVIATAGLVYELVAGAVASYVLGDSVTQFSLVIGLYLSALGVGAYLSGFIETSIARRFVDVELATALVGGVSAPLLLYAFSQGGSFHLVLWGLVLLTGTLVGLELPLLMRLLNAQVAFKDLVARALLFDYLGALAASLLFALVMVPSAGLVRTSLLAGLVNAIVGLVSTWILPEDEPGGMRGGRIRAVIVVAILVGLISQADRISKAAEVALYADPIIHARQSAYQRIIVTQGKTGFALYLNNNLQFASQDEHRYHEALVHPAFAALPKGSVKRVLIAGGGDGLAVREVLKYPEVESITLVDLDPEMTRMSRDLDLVRTQGQGLLADPRVTVINQDAMVYVAGDVGLFDLEIVDFPDPNNLALGKLYTSRFYASATRHLTPQGAMVVQSTSPFYSRQSFWCVVQTIEASGLHVLPYHTFVPAFGEWGFSLARREAFDAPTRLRVSGLSFLDDERMHGLFHFAADIARVEAPVNRLDTQALVRMYEREIGRYTN